MKSLICGTENDEKGPTETVVVVAIESSRRFRMLLSCEGEKTVRFGEPTCVKEDNRRALHHDVRHKAYEKFATCFGCMQH